MKISTRTRYAVRILVELALKEDHGPVQVKKITPDHNIPLKYREQLLRQLRLAGFVKSVRGPKGGYLLQRKPERISLGQIAMLFEGQMDLVDCANAPEKCRMADECPVRPAWREVSRILYETLDAISIADLINNQKKTSALPVMEDHAELRTQLASRELEPVS